MSFQRPLFIENFLDGQLAGIAPTYNPMFIATGLYAWGLNTSGQIGQGNTTSPQSSPVQITGTWTSVAAGNDSAAGIKSDGTLWLWGDNQVGQLGLGDTTNRSSPTQVLGGGSWARVLKGLNFFTLAYKSDGTLWAWGRNQDAGQLGVNDFVNRSAPSLVPGVWSNKFATGYQVSAAIDRSGLLWSWGNGANGAMGGGSGSTGFYSAPNQFVAGKWLDVVSGNPSLFNLGGNIIALRSDHTLWAWGKNFGGELGVGDTTDRSVPIQVGTDTTWAQIACSTMSAGIKMDGTLWTWGYNNSGELGVGDRTPRSSPTQVPGSWIFVSCGVNHMLGIKSDGSLWGWGLNSSSQLTNAVVTATSSPVQITGTWTAVAAGSAHSLGKR